MSNFLNTGIQSCGYFIAFFFHLAAKNFWRISYPQFVSNVETFFVWNSSKQQSWEGSRKPKAESQRFWRKIEKINGLKLYSRREIEAKSRRFFFSSASIRLLITFWRIWMIFFKITIRDELEEWLTISKIQVWIWKKKGCKETVINWYSKYFVNEKNQNLKAKRLRPFNFSWKSESQKAKTSWEPQVERNIFIFLVRG